MTPGFDLQRFVDAQSDVYADVVRELRDGRKRTHWMWFIFPQIAGLGHSEMAQRYAISSRAEAKAYVEHPILGARLRECTQLLLDLSESNITQILGQPDDMKFRSCMTLFSTTTAENTLFGRALNKYFRGKRDDRTLELLKATEA